MKKIIILLIIFLTICNSTYCQYIYPKENLYKMPTTPTAASFLQYGNFQPTNSNGTTDLAIPLYTIETGHLTFPITLSYNFGGIRVDDIASVAGLGWTLNTTGVIDRTIMDKPDNYYPHSVYIPSEEDLRNKPYIPWGNMAGNGQPWQHLLRAIEIVDEQPSEDLLSGNTYTVGSHTDQEKDVFRYSANGINGTFIIDDGKILQFPYTENRIILLSGIDNKKGFMIVSPDGTKYYFTTFINSNISNLTNSYNFNEGTGNLSYSSTLAYDGTTTFLLDKIIDKNDIDSITFKYENVASIRDNSLVQSYSKKNNHEHSKITNSISNTVTSRQSSEVILKEINFKSGKLIFNYKGDRTDIMTMRLTDITLYNTKKRVRKIEFDNSARFHQHRLKLSGINIMGETDNNLIDSYQFSYHEGDLKMPDYCKEFIFANSTDIVDYYSQDEFGYFNGKPNRSLLHYMPSEYVHDLKADRSFDFTYAQAYSLEKIKYSTGGITEFIYDSYPRNEPRIPALRISEIRSKDSEWEQDYLIRKKYIYSNLHDHSSNRLDPTENVYSTINLNESFAIPNIDHLYTKPNPSLSECFVLICWIDEKEEKQCKLVNKCEPIEPIFVWPKSKDFGERIYYSNPLIRNYQANFRHTYGVVEEQIISKNGDIIKNVYEYDNQPNTYELTKYKQKRLIGSMNKSFIDPKWTDLSSFFHQRYTLDLLYNSFPFGYTIDTSWKNGNLTKQTIYKQEKGVFKKVKEIINTYQFYNVNDRVRVGTTVKGLLPEQIPPRYDASIITIGNFPRDRYRLYRTTPTIDDYLFYNIYMSTGWNKLVRTEVNIYGDNTEEPVKTSIDYAYDAINAPQNPHSFLTSKSEQYDNAGSTISNYKYPYDFAENPTCKKMIEKNIINPIIQEKRSEIGWEAIANIEFKEFNVGTKTALFLSKVEEMRIKNSSLSDRVSNIKEMVVTRYDNHGNPSEIKDYAGLTTYYIWSYNGEYPVAEIKNASYNDVIKIIPDYKLQEITNKSVIADSDIQLLNKLRTIDQALVTTYTYDPLIGLLNITDYNGISTSYSYDGTGRLKETLDMENNPLQRFEYKFRAK